MTVSPDLLRRLAALKLAPSAMTEVLAIIAELQADEEERRKQQRLRKQRQRSRDRHATVTGQSRDKRPSAQSLAPKQIITALNVVSPAGAGPECVELKENPPHTPPIENISQGETRARARGTRLATDWQPSAEDRAYGRSYGFSERQIDDIAETMRLWAEANANRAVARKANWSATFKGFLRREARARPREPQLPLMTTIPGSPEVIHVSQSKFRSPRASTPAERAMRYYTGRGE